MRYPLAALCLLLSGLSLKAQPLPQTKPLERDGDLAAQMIAGIDKYLMRDLAASVEKRSQFWKHDFSSPEAYTKSLQPNRERLKKILGVVDRRISPVEIELIATTTQPALVAETDRYKIFAVRWPVLPGVDGEGLLLEPKSAVVANVVAIPDADQTPEMIVGLSPGVEAIGQFARRLAENNCRVIVPVLIDRQDTYSGNAKLGRMTNQPHREFVYRMAYEMGRHVIGYEVQKVLAAVDWFAREKNHAPIGIFGYIEGGLLALYSAAVDERVAAAVVSGYFGPRQSLWKEPIYRNVSGFLKEFGDAELQELIIPRHLFLELSQVQPVRAPALRAGRAGAAPGEVTQPDSQAMLAEMTRHPAFPPGEDGFWRGKSHLLGKIGSDSSVHLDPVTGPAESCILPFLQTVAGTKALVSEASAPKDSRIGFDPCVRQKRQFDQLCEFTQKLMRESESRRAETFWSKLDNSAVEKYQASIEPLRKQLDEEVIGKLAKPTMPPDPHSRLIFDEPTYTGYEVTLDLYPDVFAYGILLLPKDLKPGEKRPVIVCQHGLEGRPTDVVNPRKKTAYYNSFGSTLAERGYIVYAPQNPYIGHDDFRVLQRKANPLGLSLFSFIVRQHETTLDWLATLPNVDRKRIAFYGLSYGGKTAMRVPALLPCYCLSICSGDFNEWTWKNVSTDFRASYMFSPEYEMPEFNMGQTIVYAEMAALIAPRPFMVERGHDDGVGIDEWIAYEYAKVRRLYSRLGIPDRTAIEFFPGGHEIHLQGTAEFLQKHLNWPLK
jgi:dienelactone hydrolase